MTSIQKTVISCLVIVAIILGLFVYSITRSPVMSLEALKERGVFLLPTPRDIAAFQLMDHQGQPFSNEQLADHWSFLFFGFTNCPDICPTTMAEMAMAERAILQKPPSGAAFRGILITVDPERDSSSVLSEYVGAFSPNFVGIRGLREALGEFARQLNATFAKMPGEADGYNIDHSANIVIINPRGHYAGFIKMPPKAEIIEQAYRALVDTL